MNDHMGRIFCENEKVVTDNYLLPDKTKSKDSDPVGGRLWLQGVTVMSHNPSSILFKVFPFSIITSVTSYLFVRDPSSPVTRS